MNCAAFLCLSLSGLYMEMGAGYIKPLPAPPLWAVEQFGQDVHYKYDFNKTANPRGRLSLGHEWNPSKRVRVSFELRHESWVTVSADKGENGAWLSMRLLPWQWEPK